MVAGDAADSSDTIGPFSITRLPSELVLQQANSGELSFGGCWLFASLMIGVLMLGLMSVLIPHTASAGPVTVDSPSLLFAPSRNLFGILWVIGSLLILLLLPLYVVRAYNSMLTYRFSRSDDMFYKGKQKICRMRRIEYLRIREGKDSDKRFLYRLSVAYNDGQQMQLHLTYDEREALNLGNELKRFIGCPIRWT